MPPPTNNVVKPMIITVQTVKIELFDKFLVDRFVGVFRVEVRTDTAQTYGKNRQVVVNATSPQAR